MAISGKPDVGLPVPDDQLCIKARRCALSRMAVVNRVAAFVDSHLDAPLCLDDLARVGCLSKFHLHRVFLQQTSFTPAEFVNRTRLHAAVNTLRARSSGTTVLSTALSVGFNDHSAFTRAFKRTFGLTPERVLAADFSRLKSARTPIRSDSAQVHLSGLTRVVLPPFWVYGFEVQGLTQRTYARVAGKGYAALSDVLERIGVEHGAETLAVPVLYPEVLPDNDYRLLCAVRSQTRWPPSSLVERQVRGGEWLKSQHVGPHSTRWQTWYRLDRASARFLREWDDRVPFEVIHEPRSSAAPEDTVADVYFPI
jgi:AraC family transcriptional regulator